MSATTELRAAHADDWVAATTAPFLLGVADGTLPAGAFATWLVQDRLFVQALVRAWGLLLRTAPPADFTLLAAGITAFADELTWFAGLTEAGRLSLDRQPEATTRAYAEALLDLAARPRAASAAVAEVLGHEAAFWSMTTG